jgi:predicted 3-demethylubiquinone-9 3-methyltransferase (glyoxalase superfamily)
MIQPQHKITPFFWFDHQAEEAAKLYASIFDDAQILDTRRRGAGSVMSVTLHLGGQQIILFNGGPHLQLNAAASLFVDCEDQSEVDRYWTALTADGGTPSRCAWLKDKFGVSWQIVPKALGRLLSDPDPARAGRAMQAMLQMSKIDVAELERAAAG